MIVRDFAAFAEIPVSGGRHTAIVDLCDYERAIAIQWSHKVGRNGKIYAHQYRQRHGAPGPLSRFILRITDPALDVDHVSGDTLDNRRENLRPCAPWQNAHNCGPRCGGGASPYKGVLVSRNRNGGVRWRARIRVRGECFELGCFATEIEAAISYNEAARRLVGEFAWLNPIP